MALSPRLDLRQTQSLVMTPQLQQAIKLLQLNNIELTAFVEQELERNPLLEREEGEGPVGEEAPAPDQRPDGALDGALDGAFGGVLDAVVPGQAESPLDVDYDNTWSSDGGGADAGADGSLADWGGRGGRLDFEDGEGGIEQTLSRATSLRDHLVGQLNMDVADPGDRLIGLALIDLLDGAGRLVGDLDEVARQMGCPRARVDRVLARLQRFDPTGLFARDLAECLALQLRERDRLDPAMATLLAHLDLLAKRDMAGLMRLCGIDAEDLADMIAEIKALNPKPAQDYDQVVAQPITPDVLMRPAGGGGWMVELNSDTLPRVLVDTRYYAKVSGTARKKEDKTYLAERFQSANWLVKSLHQRANTILKVATEIVRQQDAFFGRGVQYLRPLVLRDIAQAIGMHESTVSRVTANKYLSSPRGIFELKYFFTQAIASNSGGESHSAEAVRHRIKTLIDGETASDVLSDDRIVEILKADGVDIARRTVAKYREAMRIASSVQRRREKSLGV